MNRLSRYRRQPPFESPLSDIYNRGRRPLFCTAGGGGGGDTLDSDGAQFQFQSHARPPLRQPALGTPPPAADGNAPFAHAHRGGGAMSSSPLPERRPQTPVTTGALKTHMDVLLNIERRLQALSDRDGRLKERFEQQQRQIDALQQTVLALTMNAATAAASASASATAAASSGSNVAGNANALPPSTPAVVVADRLSASASTSNQSGNVAACNARNKYGWASTATIAVIGVAVCALLIAILFVTAARLESEKRRAQQETQQQELRRAVWDVLSQSRATPTNDSGSILRAGPF